MFKMLEFMSRIVYARIIVITSALGFLVEIIKNLLRCVLVFQTHLIFIVSYTENIRLIDINSLALLIVSFLYAEFRCSDKAV